VARLEHFAERFDYAIALLDEVLEREPTFSLARYSGSLNGLPGAKRPPRQ
jgi:hypothetical protein